MLDPATDVPWNVAGTTVYSSNVIQPMLSASEWTWIDARISRTEIVAIRYSTTQLTLPETGVYKFSLTSVLECNMTIDGTNIINKARSNSNSAETQEASIELRRGSHSVSVEFFNLESDSAATVFIGTPSSLVDVEFDLDDFSGTHPRQ